MSSDSFRRSAPNAVIPDIKRFPAPGINAERHPNSPAHSGLKGAFLLGTCKTTFNIKRNDGRIIHQKSAVSIIFRIFFAIFIRGFFGDFAVSSPVFCASTGKNGIISFFPARFGLIFSAVRFRVVARKSPLALAQAGAVAAALSRARPGTAAEIRGVSTRGDEITDRPLAEIGGKELFVKALQGELLAGRADCAVHSLKDMAAVSEPPFVLAAVGFAEDARDVFVSREGTGGMDGTGLGGLPEGARVGTSSPRRTALLRECFPHLEAVSVRGNVQTRLAKLEGGECDALLLAAAGLIRLGLGGKISGFLPPDIFIPAVGQGILAVECATAESAGVVGILDSPEVRIRALAERAFSAAVGGDCRTPLGAHAVVEGEKIKLRAFLEVDGEVIRADVESPTSTPEECGKSAAKKILARVRT